MTKNWWDYKLNVKQIDRLIIVMVIISSIIFVCYTIKYSEYNNLLKEENTLEKDFYFYGQEKANLEDRIKVTENSIKSEDIKLSEIQKAIVQRERDIKDLENQLIGYEKLKKNDMTYFITPDNEKVLSLAENMNNNDPVEIYEFVRDKIKYVEDYTTHDFRFEYWQLPEETINLGTGDCEDQAILLCTLFRSKGYSSDDVKVAFGLTSGTNGHAWVELFYNGDWVVFDPTSNSNSYVEKTRYYSLVNINYKGSFNDITYEVIE
ncbi:MAG TPA: transglutaminase-like domain-containing protein [Methanofastidiosum sp.]|nr:transglutaminase-like domain-containing protein [Methanofastidiosum sp.]